MSAWYSCDWGADNFGTWWIVCKGSLWNVGLAPWLHKIILGSHRRINDLGQGGLADCMTCPIKI